MWRREGDDVRGMGHAPTLLLAGNPLKDDNGRSRWTLRTGAMPRALSKRVEGEQPRQLGVDAGGPLLSVGGGAAQDGAEGAGGGERLLGLLRLGEVVAVVRDDERVVQVGGEGACAFGEA